MFAFTYGYTYTQANSTALRMGATSCPNLKQDFMPYTLTRNAADPNHILTANRTNQASRDALHSNKIKAGPFGFSSYASGGECDLIRPF